MSLDPMELYLRESIFDWIQIVVPEVWAGQADFRPRESIEFIWHMEEEGRPRTPLLQGRLAHTLRIGRDTIGNILPQGNYQITGDREIMLYLTSYGEQASGALRTIQNKINDPTLLVSIQLKGIAIIDAEPIIDAHVYLDSMPEERATMDIRLRFIHQWSTALGSPSVIETVNDTGIVNP
jgi:hypothetical protein